MFSTSNKTTKTSPAVQQTSGTTFFRKVGEDSFFGVKENSSFFKPAVQAKLTVSTPDDPQEKEADAVAEKVMRMPEPVTEAPLPEKNEEKLQRKEEEIQAKEELPIANKIQCKAEPEEELQAKSDNTVYRASEAHQEPDRKMDTDTGSDQIINRKNISLYQSDVMRQSGRGPPTGSIPFEQSLASSKGSGSALPGETRQFMESRFNADFSGVRVHTDATAVQLTRNVNAQAFAHGNDIYFNSGKFSSGSTEGGTLLAHELTHTIQQGASKSNSSNNISTSVARKRSIHRSTVGSNPSLTNTATEANTLVRKPDVQKDEVDVQRKIATGHTDQKSPVKNTLQSKTALSHLHIDAHGSFHQTSPDPSVNKVTKEKELQKKEEQQPAVDTAYTLQKSTDDSSASPQKGNAIQPDAKQIAVQPTSSTLSNTDSALTANNNTVQEPVPSIKRRTVQPGSITIQRSPLDIALAHAGEILSGMPGIDDLLNMKNFLLGKMRRFASYIPGYRALGVVLGHDPITGEGIAQNGRSFIEAALDIIPGGNLLKQKLDELGVTDQAAAWIDTQIASLKGIVQNVGNEFKQAWDNLGDITSPIDVLRNLGGILERAVNNIIEFARRAAGELLDIVKKFLLTHIVTFIKQHTNAYELLKVILGKDPITEERVERNGTNILNALLELGGDEGKEQRKQMQETGTFQKAVAWIDRGIAVFGNLYATIQSGFSQIWSVVSIESLMHSVDTFNRIYATFAAPVTQVLNFVRDTLKVILGFIKEALMGRLSTWAKTVKGYSLVTVIIGKDPFTNQTVPRSVENMIHGFMSLMDGGEEQFNQMKTSGAIAKAEQRVMAAVARLNMTPEYVAQLFMQLWNAFSFADLAHPIAAFQRILNRFGEPIGRLIAFVIEIIRIVIDILLQVMQFPSDLIGNIIAKAMLAIEQIKHDPIGFLKNLLRAIKQGFMQFFGNIIRHLVSGLKDWFLGEVRAAGIPIPTDFTVMGIIKWLLVVLDITMEKVWKKLEERIGKEKVDKIRRLIDKAEQIANAAGEAYEFVQDVKKRGFMTVIIEKVKEKLSNVWDMVLDSVKSFIMDKVVSKATEKVLSMLDPTGIMAVINSAIALYKAIQSFIRYLRQMLEMVNSFVEGTLEIAKGATKKAADSLEGSLARGVPIAIGFLANQVGLDLSGSLKDTLNVVREKVDIGLTWVIGKLVTIVEKLVEKVMGAARNVMGISQDPKQRVIQGVRAGVSAVNRLPGNKIGQVIITPVLSVIKATYQLTSLEAVPNGRKWRLNGKINPGHGEDADKEVAEGTESKAGEGFTDNISKETYTIQENPGRLTEFAVNKTFNDRFVKRPNNDIAYISNVPVLVESNASSLRSPEDVAAKYRDEAFDNKDDLKSRFALVLGVNTWQDLSNQQETDVQNKVNSFSWGNYSVGIFGFSWVPLWSKVTFDAEGKKRKTQVGIDVVRNAYNAGGVDQAAAKAHEKAFIKQDTIPYGSIRDKIHQHSHTNVAFERLKEWSTNVYIQTGDADVVSLRARPQAMNTAGIQSKAGQLASGLFTRYDQILREELQIEGEMPAIISGGYEFRLSTEGGDIDWNTQALTYLANQLDIQIRERIAEHNPNIVYFPEPNTIFKAEPSNRSILLFGIGSQEGRALVKSILKTRPNGKILFDTRAIIATRTANRFNIDGQSSVTFNILTGKLENLTVKLIKSLLGQKQSIADRGTFVRNIKSAYPKKQATSTNYTEALERLYRHYVPIDSLRSDQNLLAIREVLSSTPGPFKEDIVQYLSTDEKTAHQQADQIKDIAADIGRMISNFISNITTP